MSHGSDDSANAGGALASGPETHWHIIESTDRWFQSYQHAVASTATSRSATVTRWNSQSVAGLLARLRQPPPKDAAIFLIWEYPLDEIPPTRLLDWIAKVSEQQPRAIQMAHVLPGVATSMLIALQEAGISMVLHDLWALRRVIRRSERWPATAASVR
jgi:hypothetical protein